MTRRSAPSSRSFRGHSGSNQNDLGGRSFSFPPPKAERGNGNEERLPRADVVLERPPRNDQPVNVRGNSNDPSRGGWCTPRWLAEAVGPFDLDPFSNPRSHITSRMRCSLEGGGDGFGNGDPGTFIEDNADNVAHAMDSLRVWLQPPYSKGFVQRAFRHYKHTQWTALLRFDPRPPWWQEVYDASELVAVVEIEFEPPPGVSKTGGNSFPHALYYRRAEDVTPAVLRSAAAVWRKKPRG